MTAYETDAPGATITADLDAERILVASIMARPAIIDQLAAARIAEPADITNDRLRWVWYAVEEVREQIAAGQIRWQLVDRQLQQWRADGTMPVAPFDTVELSQLSAEAEPGSWDYYGDRVARAAIAARLVAVGNDARLRAINPAFDPDRDVAEVQAALDGVARPDANATACRLGELMPGVLERAVTPPSNADKVPTGFIDLDGLLSGGFEPGQLIVVAGRPAMGKSTLGVDMARAAAIKHQVPTLFRSLEMPAGEVATRATSAEARVALHHLKQGIVADDGIARIAKANDRIQAAPLIIDESPVLTLPGLRAQIRQLTRTEGLRLVVVDYLQLMEAPRAESRQVAVSALSRGLKLIAKEFGIAMVVLAQLNRGPEQRADKRPMPSDLRESGAIEQDADIVILVHRDDAYEKQSPRAGEADLIVGKHRNGPTADITVGFQGHYSRFVDMASE